MSAEYILPMEQWVFMHSDAWHPGMRDECEHCQEVIRLFGPMPSPWEIQEAASILREESKIFRPHIPEALRWKVWERDNFTCKHCGSRIFLSIDHIVAIANGGETILDNLQTLCSTCNSRKGKR